MVDHEKESYQKGSRNVFGSIWDIVPVLIFGLFSFGLGFLVGIYMII